MGPEGLALPFDWGRRITLTLSLSRAGEEILGARTDQWGSLPLRGKGQDGNGRRVVSRASPAPWNGLRYSNTAI